MKKSDNRWLDQDYVTQGLATEIDEILTKGRFPRKKAIKQALAPITSDWVDWLNDNMREFIIKFQDKLVHQMEEGMGGGIPQVLQPPYCRIIAGKYDYCALVLEQPPQVRTIIANYCSEPFDRQGHLKVTFPFMIYMITFNKGVFDHLHVAVRTKPLTSLNDKLHLSGLPNIGPRFDMAPRDGVIPVFINKLDWPFGVCLGDQYGRCVAQCRKKTPVEQSEIVLREFWNTRFQAGNEQDPGHRPEYFSWTQWNDMSNRPLDILNIHFPEFTSLQNCLEYLLPKDMEVDAKGVHKELDRMYSECYQNSWKKLKPDGELMETASGDVSEMLENTLHYIARRVGNKLQEISDERVRMEAIKGFLTALREAVQ